MSLIYRVVGHHKPDIWCVKGHEVLQDTVQVMSMYSAIRMEDLIIATRLSKNHLLGSKFISDSSVDEIHHRCQTNVSDQMPQEP